MSGRLRRFRGRGQRGTNVLAAGFVVNGRTSLTTCRVSGIATENELAKLIAEILPNENGFDEQCMRIRSAIEGIANTTQC